MTRTRPPEERFWPKVEKTSTCWLWIGGLDSKGYGQFRVDSNRKIVAHRFAYTLLVGAIADGLQLDHLCRVRRCVNPEHLEPVTGLENWRRGEAITAQYARQTECRRGHAFTAENTQITSSGHRRCRACLRMREERRRRRAA